MAKIFLDTNVFIDLIEKRKQTRSENFLGHELFISPLSVHILTHIYKYSVPDKRLTPLEQFFNLVAFDETITQVSLQGPTKDFEDNTQLHSAARAECDHFLTEDKKLLEMKFFGKLRISSLIEMSK